MATQTILAGLGITRRLGRSRYMAIRVALELSAWHARKRRHAARQDAMAHIDPDVDPNDIEAGGLTVEDLCEVRRGLERVKARLDERCRYVLFRRLAGDHLHEIGADMSLSAERVRQIHQGALRVVAAPRQPP